jgi:hypothetical protein
MAKLIGKANKLKREGYFGSESYKEVHVEGFDEFEFAIDTSSKKSGVGMIKVDRGKALISVKVSGRAIFTGISNREVQAMRQGRMQVREGQGTWAKTLSFSQLSRQKPRYDLHPARYGTRWVYGEPG